MGNGSMTFLEFKQQLADKKSEKKQILSVGGEADPYQKVI